jgi:hypothetical protein
MRLIQQIEQMPHGPFHDAFVIDFTEQGMGLP